jgi:II/X family phage/plasmid replication protein
MSIDTIRLRSPFIDEGMARQIEASSIQRRALDMRSGEILWEITTGNLEGSWDSRIMVRIMREEHYPDKNGFVKLRDCEPYVMLECSAHKVLMGHNIYGGPIDFKETVTRVIEFLERYLGVGFPPVSSWIVRRVDWAEVFRLPFVAISEFFEGLQTVQFPRRKASKHGSHSMHFPGSTTTVKLYHKGPEFREHDFKKLKRYFTHYRTQQYPHAKDCQGNTRWVTLKLEALQRLANNRLRVEVGVNSIKLDRDFGHPPFVHEVTDEYLTKLHDREITKLLKEGKEAMETARTNRDVSARLKSIYGPDDRMVGILFGFWMQLAGLGEEVVKANIKRTTFYRLRKSLQDAGISWFNTNVYVLENKESALPKNFKPLRTDARICTMPAKQRPYHLSRDPRIGARALPLAA